MRTHPWLGALAIVAALSGRAAAQGQAGEGPAFQEEPPKGPAKRKIDAKLEVEQFDGRWRFVVRGTTDLPDGTQLKARIHVIERTTGPRGEPRFEDEQISSRRDGWARRFETSKGAFEVVAFERARKPFSLEYQARIQYERSGQDPKLAEEIGEEDFEVRVTRPPAAPKDLEIEFREAAKDISADLEKILLLFSTLKVEFVRQQGKYDGKAWEAWRKSWTGRVEAIEEKNNERWDLWAAWLERQGRFRVESLDAMLTGLAGLCDAGLRGNAASLKGAQHEFEAFMNAFQESRELVGLDAPFDIPEVTEQLKRYADAVESMRKASEAKTPADWAKGAEGWRTQARGALLRLSAQRLIPRRGYEQVLGLSDAYLVLEPLLEKAAEGKAGDPDRAELAKRLEEHGLKLKAFRDYAGIQ